MPWETLIICRQFIQSAETNVFGMARGPGAATGSCPRLLHCLLARPLVLLLLAIVGFIFHNDPAGAWRKMTEQMSYFLDKSAIDVVAEYCANRLAPE